MVEVCIVVPDISSEILEQFERVYTEAYPKNQPLKDSKASYMMMWERKIRNGDGGLIRFIHSSFESTVISLDQYYFTLQKNPLRVTDVRMIPRRSPIAFVKGHDLDVERVVFPKATIDRFAVLFPDCSSINLEKVARIYLAKANEVGAIKDYRRGERIKKYGESRYFLFAHCRFVVVKGRRDGLDMVITVEDSRK